MNKVDCIQSEVKNIRGEMSYHRSAGTSEKITGRALTQIDGLQPPVQNLKNQLRDFAESGLAEKSPSGALSYGLIKNNFQYQVDQVFFCLTRTSQNQTLP